MSVRSSISRKPLAFLTSLMVLFALVVPLIGTAGATHGTGDPNVITVTPGNTAPTTGQCTEVIVQANGGSGNTAPAEGETIDIRVTQSDTDNTPDLVIGFCDPDGGGQATNLSGPPGDPTTGTQTQGTGTGATDCDDNNTDNNGACGPSTGAEFPARLTTECLTATNGSCRFGVTSNEGSAMLVEAWFDRVGAGCTDGTLDAAAPCNEPNGNATINWSAGGTQNVTGLTCTPANDANPDGSRHEFQCTATNAAGTGLSGITVNYDVTAGPNNEEVPPTSTCVTGTGGQTTAPGAQDPRYGGQTATTAGTCGYNDNLQGAANSPPGVDTIVAWVNRASQSGQPAATSGPDAGEPQVTISKTFFGAARTLDCEPETHSTAVGNSHTITCTARDRLQNPVRGVGVEFLKLSGPGTLSPQGTGAANEVVTDAAGQARATISTGVNDAVGTATVRGQIGSGTVGGVNNTAECQTAANQPVSGAPQGVCQDDVQVTFTRATPTEEPQPQCNDGIDNDGDGRVDYPDDPGCSGLADTTESPNPAPSVVNGSTTLSHKYSGNKHNGKVGSNRKICRRGRTVIVKEPGQGIVGSDRTNRRGKWSVRDADADGRFTSKVRKQTKRRPDGTRVRCRAARASINI